MDGKADYGALDELAAQRVNTALIIQHWEDDLLRLAGSLKLGTVQAAGLIRTLQTKDRPTKLARALEELGRLIKTLYLLRLIDDAAYRRRILVQLNRGEGRHQLARTVFHGKRGELRQRYREGQEDQLGALGLVVNVIVLWNTIYMDAALDQLRAEGFDVRAEDVARLSPLGFEHMNMLGRYAFILPDRIARGELRPLRDPAAAATTRAELQFRFRCYRNPSMGGGRGGNVTPMLLDLASKPMFLHDGSVDSLEDLLSPDRGVTSPHPFYIADRKRRADVVQFLRGLDTEAGARR